MGPTQRTATSQRQTSPKTLSVIPNGSGMKPTARPIAKPTANKGGQGRLIALIVLVLIVAAGIYYWLQQTPVTGISSSGQTFVIAPNHNAYFTLAGVSGTKAIFVSSSVNGTATLYLGTVPILANPVDEVTLSLPGAGAYGSGQVGAVNASSSAGGAADMHIALLNANASGAEFQITPIQASLSLPISRQVKTVLPIMFVQNGAGGFGLTYNYTNGGSSTTVSTTTTTGSTVTSVTVTSATSTITSGGGTNAQVMADANASSIGILMNKFAKLYAADASCNSTTYNSTYKTKNSGALPTGPATWQNQSFVVPYGMSTSITSVRGSIYDVNYILASGTAAFNKAAMTLVINVSATLPVVNYTTKGYYIGLNLTQLQTSYNSESGVTNNCGAWVA